MWKVRDFFLRLSRVVRIVEIPPLLVTSRALDACPGFADRNLLCAPRTEIRRLGVRYLSPSLWGRRNPLGAQVEDISRQCLPHFPTFVARHQSRNRGKRAHAAPVGPSPPPDATPCGLTVLYRLSLANRHAGLPSLPRVAVPLAASLEEKELRGGGGWGGGVAGPSGRRA